jgi:hypothetical protein
MSTGTGPFVPYPERSGTFPMLDALPAGRLASSRQRAPGRRQAEVLHSDATWRPCTVLAWARQPDGWAVLIRWPDGTQDWRGFDHRYLRPQPRPSAAPDGEHRPARPD